MWIARLAALAGLGYVIVLGVAMQRTGYDTWGALVIVPLLVVASVPLIARAFAGEWAWLRPYAWLALAAKIAGAVVGYNVRFGIYGRGDAALYHDIGRTLATNIWNGNTTLFELLPTSTGTEATEEITGLVFALVGTSRLGGFIVFAWFSYWGLMFMLKAALVAVPGLAARRYALLLALFPSLVYWGSSIGKEAIVGFGLGLATYGVALVLTTDERRRTGMVMVVVALVATARIRPHFAALWAGALVVGLIWRSIRDVRRDGRASSKLATVAMSGVAVAGFVAISLFTLDFLAPPDDEAAVDPVEDRFTLVFDRTSERTTTGGSAFTPVSTASPVQWPYAAYRTLTRPLIIEARSVAELLPAIEMTLFLAAAAWNWRRLLWLARALPTNPFVVFVLLAMVTFGIAFASIGNLGILVRQRSAILPLLLLILCVPSLSRARRQPETLEPHPEGGRNVSAARTPVG